MSRVFGYGRVSTIEQDPENQLLEIQRAGFTIEKQRWVTDKVSGSTCAADRPGWQKLLNKLEPGDRLVVAKLDRLGRNAADIRSTVEDLAAREVAVHVLQLGAVDMTSSSGKLFMQMLAAFSEFERDLIRERTNAGLAKARRDGKQLGRPGAMTEAQKKRCAVLRVEGQSLRMLAKEFNVAVNTIVKALEEQAA